MNEKYRLTADYHTHTTMSHGKGSVKDNVEQAVKLGLDAIAISDHGPGHLLFGVRDVRKYLDEIARVRREFEGKIRVLASLELNFTSTDGNWDMPGEFADEFDLRLVGAHECVKNKNPWYFIVEKRWNKVKNTDLVVKGIHKHKPFALTHPGYGMAVDYEAIARACAETGTLFEINTKHRQMDEKTVEELAGTGVKFLVSSDAHRPESVGSVQTALGLVYGAQVADRVYNLERI